MTGQAYTSYTVDYGTDGKPTSAAYSNGMTATWTYNTDGTSQIDYAGVTGAAFAASSLTDDADGRPATATYNNGMTASYLSNGSHDVLYDGVTGQPYSAYEMHYGSDGRPTTAFYNNGMMATWTYNADGSYAVAYDGVTGSSYTSDTINYGLDGRPESATYSSGMTSTWTYADDGAHVVAYQGMSGSAGYTSHASLIDASGQTVADAEDMNDGSGILRLFGSNLTISSSASGLNVTTGADSSTSLLTPMRRSPSSRRLRKSSTSRPALATPRFPACRPEAQKATYVPGEVGDRHVVAGLHRCAARQQIGQILRGRVGRTQAAEHREIELSLSIMTDAGARRKRLSTIWNSPANTGKIRRVR